MSQTAISDLYGHRTASPLPRPRDIMTHAYPADDADRVYLNAQRQVDGTSPAGRVYLADLAEALGIVPSRWRALQAMAEKATPGN